MNLTSSVNYLLLAITALLGVELLAQRKVIAQWRHAQTELRRLRIRGQPLASIAAQGSAIVLEQENVVCIALKHPLPKPKPNSTSSH